MLFLDRFVSLGALPICNKHSLGAWDVALGMLSANAGLASGQRERAASGKKGQCAGTARALCPRCSVLVTPGHPRFHDALFACAFHQLQLIY